MLYKIKSYNFKIIYIVEDDREKEKNYLPSLFIKKENGSQWLRIQDDNY